MRRHIGVSSALAELCPKAQWTVRDEDYDKIEWYSEDIKKPTRKQVEEKIAEQKANEGLYGLREVRDWYLQQSDWTQGQDIRAIRGEEWCKAWDEYRQKLRDMTEIGLEPYFDEHDILQGITWPEKPDN